MTAILAINLHYKIIVVADCRVTWTRGDEKIHQDNIQKLYPIGKFGIVGFSGDLKLAKPILEGIKARLNSLKVGFMGLALAELVQIVAQEEFDKLADEDRGELQLLVAGPLTPKPTLRATNVSMFDAGLFQLDSPKFSIKQNNLAAKLGYARDYPNESVEKLRNDIISHGLTPESANFQTIIAVWKLSEELVQIGGKDVGDCLIAASMDLDGIKWHPVGGEDGVQLRIENGGFVLSDRNSGDEVRVETIFEYDVGGPDSGEKTFGSPFN